jgi:hypothetical protein
MLTRVCLCRRLQGHEGSQPAQADDPQGQKKRLSSAGEEDSSAGELGSSNAAQNESEEDAPALKRPHVAGRRTSHMRKEECGAELAAAGLSTEGTTLQLRSRVAEHRQSMKSPKER